MSIPFYVATTHSTEHVSSSQGVMPLFFSSFHKYQTLPLSYTPKLYPWHSEGKFLPASYHHCQSVQNCNRSETTQLLCLPDESTRVCSGGGYKHWWRKIKDILKIAHQRACYPWHNTNYFWLCLHEQSWAS